MDKPKKVLFLDVDGVFTSARANGYGNFDIYAVNFVIWACIKSGAKIVISSTWRNAYDRTFWQTIFGANLIHEDYKTSSLASKLESGLYVSPIRGDEIGAWLKEHSEVEDYLILDDDSDFTDEQKPHFIKTDSYNGLLFDDMMKIRDYLKIETFPREQKEFYQHPNMFEATREKRTLANPERAIAAS